MTNIEGEGRLPPISVLIVEDEGVIALDMKRKLMRLGCETVATVSDGQAAISLAEQMRPDVVVMDIGLGGGMDGITAATVIHERFAIPIIFASAYLDRAALSLAESGISASCLVKPFSELDLRLGIQAALSRRQA